MHIATTHILALADAIPGYGRDQLLADLEAVAPANRFFTREQAAERYQVTTQTIANWVRDGILPCSMKLDGGSVRFTALDFRAFELKNRGRKGAGQN